MYSFFIPPVKYINIKFVTCQDVFLKSPYGGGTAGDVMRNFTGWISSIFALSAGAVFSQTPTQYIDIASGGSYGAGRFNLTFNPALHVPTGAENSGRTFGVNKWRRVA